MEPPHGRGKVACADQTIQPDGITPAWAGKRDSATVAAALSRDHPRVGGEKPLGKVQQCVLLGSPPHGRGKGGLLSGGLHDLGITPAWAGKSLCWCSNTSGPRDHPRVGGEKGGPLAALRRNRGSPPRGRGKVRALLCSSPVPGITPAWAGKSSASQPWSPPLWMMVIRPRP